MRLVLGDDVANAFGVCELFGELHHQSGDGDTARGTQKFRLIVLLYPHHHSVPDHILRIRLEVLFLERCQLILEKAHFVLQVDDIISGDPGAFCLIEVLAV